MKIKTFFVFMIIIITIFIIYIFNIDNKIYYINISDNNTNYNLQIKRKLEKIEKLEKYVNINNKDYRVTDLINIINNNENISDKQTIQNALIKADILTIQIGNNELEYKTDIKDTNELFEYSDELLNDLDKLFKLIRIYDKEKIYFFGYKNAKNEYFNEIYDYLNLKLKDLCDQYNIIFLD